MMMMGLLPSSCPGDEDGRSGGNMKRTEEDAQVKKISQMKTGVKEDAKKKDSESDSGKIKMQRIYGRGMGRKRMEDEVVEDVIDKRTGEGGQRLLLHL